MGDFGWSRNVSGEGSTRGGHSAFGRSCASRIGPIRYRGRIVLPVETMASESIDPLLRTCAGIGEFGKVRGHERISCLGSEMTKLNEYIKIAEAAKVLGVSQNTLRVWAEAGKVPVRRNPANGYRLFHRNELEEFLKRVRSGSTEARKTDRCV